MMIKLHKIDKFYNRRKRNELHVLNDVSLELQSKGLVVLLGASGSGKTTLLNVLGGLDRFHHGEMVFEEEHIKKYRSRQLDDLRLKDVGIIFQNYYLIPNLTVYENIAMTLRVLGITDEETLDQRIDYVLSAVNMKNYKKRKASQLSGGQQQRVAIARAIVKNPKVILADEPTGNLDSKNTFEIMRIIKAISKEKLVVMVTHERKLANFFADRIIEIEDGKILRDEENISNGDLNYDTETDIYLKDFKEPLEISKDTLDISYFSDEETLKPINIKLVVKNKTLYLDVQNEDLKKIVVLDDKSEVKLRDESKSKTQDKTTETPIDFDTKNLELTNTTHAKKSVIDIKQVFTQTVNRLLDASKGSRLLYLGFAIGAMIMAYALSNLFLIITVDDDDILRMPKETIVIQPAQFDSLDDFLALNELDFVKDTSFVSQTYTTMKIPPVFIIGRGLIESTNIDVQFVPFSLLTEQDITHGRLPESPDEIIVDQAWINQVARYNETLNSLNYKHPQSFLNIAFTMNNGIAGYDTQFTIVGVSNVGVPVVYASELIAYQLSTYEYYSFELFQDSIVLEAGALPENINDILVPANDFWKLRIDDLPFTHTVNNTTYTVVGLYHLEQDGELTTPQFPMVTRETLRQLAYGFRAGFPLENYVYVTNVNQALNYFEAENIEAEHIYTIARQEYFARNLNIGNLIFTGIAIFASALSFYFIIRSSMISRIYELGVYRSLGIKKWVLIKRFIIESAVITTFSSLIGFLLMNYIIFSAQNAVGEFTRIGYVTIPSMLIGILIIYSVNVLSGVIPVAKLLQKTPAEINTQYDL